MSCLTQFGTVNFIHHYCDIGVWTRMAIKFSQRIASVDDRTDSFLTSLAHLGGYCTAEQAQAIGLASSISHVQARLNGLERAGFLRRVAPYPAVYQVTKSVVRLVGTDMSARRRHPVETVRWRLAAVSFYLDAKSWPADFIFQHEKKISALEQIGCAKELLPHRGGQPYLREEFVVRPGDSGLCIVVVDRPHWNAQLQLMGFVKRFSPCRAEAGERLSFAVAVGSESRRRLYEEASRHRTVLKHSGPEPTTVYEVSTPTPYIRTLNHEPVIHTNLDSRRQ